MIEIVRDGHCVACHRVSLEDDEELRAADVGPRYIVLHNGRVVGRTKFRHRARDLFQRQLRAVEAAS